MRTNVFANMLMAGIELPPLVLHAAVPLVLVPGEEHPDVLDDIPYDGPGDRALPRCLPPALLQITRGLQTEQSTYCTPGHNQAMLLVCTALQVTYSSRVRLLSYFLPCALLSILLNIPKAKLCNININCQS